MDCRFAAGFAVGVPLALNFGRALAFGEEVVCEFLEFLEPLESREALEFLEPFEPCDLFEDREFREPLESLEWCEFLDLRELFEPELWLLALLLEPAEFAGARVCECKLALVREGVEEDPEPAWRPEDFLSFLIMPSKFLCSKKGNSASFNSSLSLKTLSSNSVNCWPFSERL